MGYSKNKEVLERVRPLLDLVLQSSDAKISFPSKHPNELVYAVREALNYAEKHSKTEDKKYGDIKLQYRIRSKPDRVVFELKNTLDYELDPILEIADAFQMLEIPEVSSHLEVVGACIKHKAVVMKFPDAQLDETELEFLRRWTNKNHYDIEATLPLVLRKNAGSTAEDDTAINS